MVSKAHLEANKRYREKNREKIRKSNLARYHQKKSIYNLRKKKYNKSPKEYKLLLARKVTAYHIRTKVKTRTGYCFFCGTKTKCESAHVSYDPNIAFFGICSICHRKFDSK